MPRPVLIALAACCALLLGSGAEACGSTVERADDVGVNAQFLFPKLPRSEWDRHLDAMATAGVGVVRYDATWDWVQPSPGLMHWEHYDAVVAALAAHGLRWLPVVDYSARWASSIPGDWRAPPADFTDYDAFAAAVARRYGRGGSFWAAHPELQAVPVTQYEVWNEPNWRAFWRPAPDARAYADLYAGARAAIRAVDPQAQVIVGGLVPDSAPAFVRSMLAARPQLAGGIDAVGLHPYHREADGVVDHVRDLRRTLDDLDLQTTSIAVTELGWPSRGTDNAWLVVDDAARAQRLSETVTTLGRSNCDVSVITVHTWVTPERDPAATEDWFGLRHSDASPTISGIAFDATVRSLAGDPTRDRKVCGDRRNTTSQVTPAPAGTFAPPPEPAAAAPSPGDGPAVSEHDEVNIGQGVNATSRATSRRRPKRAKRAKPAACAKRKGRALRKCRISTRTRSRRSSRRRAT